MLCPLSPSSQRLQVLGGPQTAQNGPRKHISLRNGLPKGTSFLQGGGMATSHPGLSLNVGRHALLAVVPRSLRAQG